MGSDWSFELDYIKKETVVVLFISTTILLAPHLTLKKFLNISEDL